MFFLDAFLRHQCEATRCGLPHGESHTPHVKVPSSVDTAPSPMRPKGSEGTSATEVDGVFGIRSLIFWISSPKTNTPFCSENREDILISWFSTSISTDIWQTVRFCLRMSLPCLCNKLQLMAVVAVKWEKCDSMPVIQMGVSVNGGTPKRMVYNGKPY